MHRKFIALIVATAITITGVSASQARAADAKDVLGGLAAIAIIGAGVHYYNKEKRKNRVTRAPAPVYTAPTVDQYPVRPLPQHVARYNLPQRCLRTFKGYGQRSLLGTKCLKKHYKHANSLPQQCKVGFWNGKKVKRAYEPACLRQQGYHVVYK
ncbi:hypothetical protein HW561_17810 [Rhodobacteraceae bacterium B1Z28]|uniref:Uncharacterized protein n=1 Tax=Ruegeria haliotis TaxID=2747601 RepID=A0ABX2PU33_9RHOB|nr:hypothetical protein [Ruegeria haliotis]NVO57656.1 hypothetical protein [Ruegeria haliotis]